MTTSAGDANHASTAGPRLDARPAAPRRSAGLVVALLGIAILAVAAPAGACKFEHSTLIGPTPGSDPLRFDFTSSVEQTRFDVSGRHGNYTRFTQGLEYRDPSRLSLGARVPFITLESEAGRENAVGNPTLFGEASLVTTERTSLRLGTQLELPIGQNEPGLASDHVETLPYLGITHRGSRFTLLSDLGFRVALGGDEGDQSADEASGKALHPEPATSPDGSPGVALMVDPHADEEFLYRFGVTSHWPRLSPTLYVDGQLVLGHTSGDDHFSTAGLAVAIPVAGRYRVVPAAQLPITSAKRFDGSFRLDIHALF